MVLSIDTEVEFAIFKKFGLKRSFSSRDPVEIYYSIIRRFAIPFFFFFRYFRLVYSVVLETPTIVTNGIHTIAHVVRTCTNGPIGKAVGINSRKASANNAAKNINNNNNNNNNGINSNGNIISTGGSSNSNKSTASKGTSTKQLVQKTTIGK